nr:nodulation factor fucose acetyltransferase NolL [Bradyrhizobium sp. ORS 285]
MNHIRCRIVDLNSQNLTGVGTAETPEANDRDLSLDFTKGVLIVLVIVGHLIQYIIYRDDGFWCSPYFKWIYMFHMPLFMAISGYLSCRALLQKSLACAVWDRALQLLLPMLFWCAVLETVKLAAFPSPHDATGFSLALLYDVVGTYWFVWAAFICFLFVKLLLIFDRSLPLLLLLSVVAVELTPLTISIVPLIKYTYPFFCLGFAFSQSRAHWTRMRGGYKLLLIAFVYIAACASFLVWHRDTYVYNNLALVRDLISAKSVLLMLFGSAAASAIMSEFLSRCWRLGRSTRVFRFIAIDIGQSTLLLYLIQGTVFRLMDSIQYAEPPDLATGLAVGAILGGTLVLFALLVRKMISENPFLSQLLLGASPRIFR